MSGEESIQSEIIIRQMQEGDIERIRATFTQWHKRRKKFERYLIEQQQNRRIVIVASNGETEVGYVTLVWQSDYEPFKQKDIPEIVDLNVMTEYQTQGFGTRLICAAEQTAFEHSKQVIGISVEQSSAYAVANRLYQKLGYVPDENGITPQDNELYLIKQL